MKIVSFGVLKGLVWGTYGQCGDHHLLRILAFAFTDDVADSCREGAETKQEGELRRNRELGRNCITR